MFVPQWVIEKKCDGGELSAEDIRSFIGGYTSGAIPDYQMSALAMAIRWRGMTPAETSVLTDVMMHSGECLDFSGLPRPSADKHSTGGIGDKLSFVVAPLAVAGGLAVPMIAGRGLGITGGTVDKLESIPGYRTQLSLAEFRRVVETVGCSIIGQTPTIAPADRKLYALRDVTGTVPSVPLITASILSKKLAEGASTLVFDVKCGPGAFMKTPAEARELAASLVRVGTAAGRKVSAVLTAMDQPLGRAVGNAVEVAEALEVLRGGGPLDVREMSVELAVEMLAVSGARPDRAAARRALKACLARGRALEIFRDMVAAQGGDARVAEDFSLLPRPGAVAEVPAEEAGIVQSVDAQAVGRIVLELGGGRVRAGAAVDLAAGIDRLVQAGEPVGKGQPLMRLLAKDEATLRPFIGPARAAVRLGASAPAPRKLFLEGGQA